MSTIRGRLRELFERPRYDWLLMVSLCSFLGFLVENIWNYLANGYIDNRNMYMPFLIGYGIAILLIYVFFGVPRSKYDWLYFVKVCIFVTLAEISLGYVVEWICGFRYWDYTAIPLHFTPYASIFSTAGFSLIISFFMGALFTPAMERFDKITKHIAGKIAGVLLVVGMTVDFFASFAHMYLSNGINDVWLFAKDLYAFVSKQDLVILIGMFFIYSFMGWVVESLYISWTNKKWTNRGFLKAPLCPVYGFAEFIGYRLLLLLPHNYFLYFIIGTAFVTSLELLLAKFMIYKTGYVWWDYTNKPFNYKGILCLESTVAWGAYAVAEMWFIHDSFEAFLNWIPYNALTMILIGLILYTIGDLIYSIRKVKTEGLKAEENNMLKVR